MSNGAKMSKANLTCVALDLRGENGCWFWQEETWHKVIVCKMPQSIEREWQ
jgi:hypothetical protein